MYFLFMRYRYACEVNRFREGAMGPRMRDGILFTLAGTQRFRLDEPESLILAQSERWRHA
jgi:hypothetical protein